MKGDIWYLKDTSDCNRILAKFEFKDDFFTGNCWRAVSWYDNGVFDWEFVADVFCKWDACTQWYFNGETYDPVEDAKTHDNEIDAYYHLCGGYCMFEHVRCMCFVWKLAEMIFGDSEWYYEHDGMDKLVKLMLTDCVIEKEEKQHD